MLPCVRVWASGFRVQGSGFRVQSSEFRVQGSGFRSEGVGGSVEGVGFRFQTQILNRGRFRFFLDPCACGVGFVRVQVEGSWF